MRCILTKEMPAALIISISSYIILYPFYILYLTTPAVSYIINLCSKDDIYIYDIYIYIELNAGVFLLFPSFYNLYPMFKLINDSSCGKSLSSRAVAPLVLVIVRDARNSSSKRHWGRSPKQDAWDIGLNM